MKFAVAALLPLIAFSTACSRPAPANVGATVNGRAITYAELEYGVSVAANPKRERANLASLIEDIPVAPFDAQAGVAYGPIRLATRSSKADHLDKLIAAQAVALGVTVVTNNVKDFAKYPGVSTENWLASRS